MIADNLALISVICLILLFIAVFALYERKSVSTKEIALIATLSAISGIMRIPFAGLPNIQPSTFFILVSGYVFGPGIGFMVGMFSPLVTNMFIGQGPWTVWQMLAWGLCGASAGLARFVPDRYFRIGFSLYAFVWGFLFDYIMNLWHWLFFIKPLTLASFLLTYASSFYFDIMHAIGNFAFSWFLSKDIVSILSRFKDKLYFKRI